MCIAVTSHRMLGQGSDDPFSTQKGSTLDAHMVGRPKPFAHRRSPAKGAFMEPSGRNRWQPVANGSALKPARIGRLATDCNPRHGKEGSTVRVRQRALERRRIRRARGARRGGSGARSGAVMQVKGKPESGSL
jgi:hypothetical protein